MGLHSCSGKSLPLSPSTVAAEFRADTSKLLDKIHPKPNIIIQETRAIKELKSDQSRIILTADKGVAMVVIGRQEYNTKAQGLLDKETYRHLSKHPNAKLKNCEAQGKIDQATYKTTPHVPSPPILWLTQNPHARNPPQAQSVQ